MRNTRLIILLSALGGLAAVIIVMSAVFTVYNTDAVCGTAYAEDSKFYQTMLDVGEEVKKVADDFRHKNIFLFDKDAVISAVNAKVARAEAYEVECVFPNKIVVRYKLVTEDLQFTVGDKYIVTGTSGKIVKVNNYDSASESGGHYNDTLIAVTPYAAPVGETVCEYAYSDRECYDMAALNLIVGLPELLVNKNGKRTFDKASYAAIDLSDKSTVRIKMRSGLTFKLLGGANNLKEKVTSMVSWYSNKATDFQSSHGLATISDVNPENVAWSSTVRP